MQGYMRTGSTVVSTTGPTSRVGSSSGSTQNWTVAMGLNTSKSWLIGNGPVSPPKTRHFNTTTLPSIKYLSSDHIVTWSVRRLCSSSYSLTSQSRISDPTNIRWVAIENPLISLIMCPYFSATQRISVWSQIWILEVKEVVKLHNLCIHHVMIRSELKYLIAA